MAKSDLVVLQEMTNNDMDIRSTNTIVEAKTVKQGGILSFGGEQYVAVCYIINAKQFFELKNKQ